MEVHAHTHTARKKWTHYFWEFLMLFLAVFCGFLAEYQLEHTIENQREKQYMQSLTEDIRQDIQVLDNGLKKIQLSVLGKDSLVQLLQNEKLTPQQEETFYNYHWKYVGYVTEFPFSKRTLMQLLNAGGLRLVRNKKVSGAIATYAAKVEYHEQTRQPQYIDDSYRALYASSKLVNTKYLRAVPDDIRYTRAAYEKPVIRNATPENLSDFSFAMEMDKENCILFMQNLVQHQQLAKSLLQLLEQEYKIK